MLTGGLYQLILNSRELYFHDGFFSCTYSTSSVSEERRKCWATTDEKSLFCALRQPSVTWRYLNNIKVFFLYRHYMLVGFLFNVHLNFMPLWIYVFITQNNHGMVVIVWALGGAAVSHSEFPLSGFWLAGPTSFFLIALQQGVWTITWQDGNVPSQPSCLHLMPEWLIWKICASFRGCNLWAIAPNQPKPSCVRHAGGRKYGNRRMQSCYLVMVMQRGGLLKVLVCYLYPRRRSWCVFVHV